MPSLKGLARWLVLSNLLLAGTVTRGAEWKHIRFPQVPAPGALGETFQVSASPNRLNPEPLWQFNITWGPITKVEPQGLLADASQVAVLWHSGDGEVRRPRSEFGRWGGVSMGRGIQYSLIASFSHAGGGLSDGWVELKVPGQSFWFQLPYGVVRTPDAPRVDEPERGRPALPSTMKVAAGDQLISWQNVEYDVGPIQNGWRLMLSLANPLMLRAEATLYAERHRWQLDAPRTSMTVDLANGNVIGSRKTSIRLHEDGMRRSEIFRFQIPNLPESWRGWGRAVVMVDDQRWECPIPSSLFQYAHGVAVPEHPQRFWPRPSPE